MLADRNFASAILHKTDSIETEASDVLYMYNVYFLLID